jgi:hypothetical protein
MLPKGATVIITATHGTRPPGQNSSSTKCGMGEVYGAASRSSDGVIPKSSEYLWRSGKNGRTVTCSSTAS